MTMRNDARHDERHQRRHAIARRASRHAAALALCAAVSGCLSLAPDYVRKPLPVPASYPAYPGDPAGANARTPGQLDWRAYFVDPRLQALIETALANNRDLRIASRRVEQARAAYGIRRADQFPTIAANAAYLRFREPGGLLLPSPIIGELYSASLSEVQWEIDFWGRVRSLKAAALDTFLASDASRRAVTISLIGQVADAYLSLCAYDERLALTNETIASRRESLRIFRRRYEEGAISKLDLTQSEILLQQAQTLGSQLQQARDVQQHALDLLVGASASAAGQAPAPLDDASIAPDLAPSLPSELLASRPDVVAAEYQLRAAHANIGAARAAFFPRIALTSSIGTGSTELHNLFASGTTAWSFIPNLSVPIFDAGRNISNLKLANARRDEALAQYEKTIQSAFRDVADALAARHWLAEQVRIAQETLATQTERARLAKLRYDSGAARFLEVLDAQRDLLNAQQQLVQTRRALLASRVALYAALGGRLDEPARGAAAPRASSEPSAKQGPLS
ncbi:efflux transporter outer membrane subunit [Burkholderia thailandensis]|uniref:efflux transporter outer membrane subunit n=1 Tax=Burkholderia thailandensis TaxID=57975 RepID=UPI0005BB3165|nr:efflux transporter outer membrane subunit [Burkholderia thailandensis]AVR06928.1 RND transporter [Burkholderia thailandensis]